MSLCVYVLDLGMCCKTGVFRCVCPVVGEALAVCALCVDMYGVAVGLGVVDVELSTCLGVGLCVCMSVRVYVGVYVDAVDGAMRCEGVGCACVGVGGYMSSGMCSGVGGMDASESGKGVSAGMVGVRGAFVGVGRGGGVGMGEDLGVIVGLCVYGGLCLCLCAGACACEGVGVGVGAGVYLK
eukprot:2397797-Pleurochrysis_carterae.AAC.2